MSQADPSAGSLSWRLAQPFLMCGGSYLLLFTTAFPSKTLARESIPGKAHPRYVSTNRAGQEKCRKGYSCLMGVEAEPCVFSGQLHTQLLWPPHSLPHGNPFISQVVTTKRWCKCGQKNEDLATFWCLNHKVKPLSEKLPLILYCDETCINL